jgi:HEAT repeat protein
MTISQITGREPALATGAKQKGSRRLSLRRLGTLLNVLPPNAISLDAVKEALNSQEFFVRYNAAKMLARRADRDSRLIIEETLKSGHPMSRASVARHLYGFSWFAAKPLIEIALKDKDARVREGAVYALCDFRDLNAYQMLVDVLKNEEDSVREAAAFGLRDTQDPAAIPVLEEVLNAKDPDVRIKALEALGTNDNPEATPIVRECMKDPDPEVKYAAALSLLELSGESWLAELSGVIGRNTGETLKQVLRAFFHATNYLKIDVAKSSAAELMIDALETALLDESAGVRTVAIWPLAWMRHERVSAILRKTYRIELDPEVKAHIVRVSAGLMSEASEEILQAALQSTEEQVKSTAEKIISDRERAGQILTYNENSSNEGIALHKPLIYK